MATGTIKKRGYSYKSPVQLSISSSTNVDYIVPTSDSQLVVATLYLGVRMIATETYPAHYFYDGRNANISYQEGNSYAVALMDIGTSSVNVMLTVSGLQGTFYLEMGLLE